VTGRRAEGQDLQRVPRSRSMEMTVRSSRMSVMARPRTWTDEQLIEAVATSQSWVEVARKLGSAAASPTTRHLRQHAARLQLDTGHLPARTPVASAIGSPEPLDLAAVAAAVSSSNQWAKARRSYSGGAIASGLQCSAAIRRGALRPSHRDRGRIQAGAVQDRKCAIAFNTISRGKRYSGDVDYFGVHEPISGSVYMIPFEVVGSRRVVHLRVNGKAGGRNATHYLVA
jgi:hypothetical protein